MKMSLVAVILFGSLPALSFAVTSSHPVLCDPPIDIVVQPWYDNLPEAGMVPVTVRITNHSTQAGQWELNASDRDYRGGSMHSRYTMSVPAGATVSSSFVVGLSPNGESLGVGYKNMMINVSGPNVKNFSGVNLSTRMPTSGRGSASTSTTGYILIGEKFESAHGSIFKALSATKSYEWMGDSADMSKAPTDWRGYSGLEQVWLLDSEWTAMNEQQHQALLTWVGAGGKAFIVGTHGAGATPLPEGIKWDQGQVRLGMGALREITKAEVDTAVKKWATNKDGVSKLLKQPVEAVRLSSLIPALRVNGALIFCFILVFGVTVGPINLFWLARGNKRPRLFWTTPLISLAGALVLVAVMLMQDGTGGAGARVMFATLIPEMKQMVVVQEQFSKTGVLLGHSFELPEHESTWLSPLPVLVQKKGRYGNSEEVTDKRNYSLSGLSAAGGWFASRAVQSQLLHTVRLNRTGLEIREGASPEVISSLPTELARLYAVDSQKQYWTAEHVPIGRKTVLTKSSKEDFNKWITKDVKTKVGSYLFERMGDSASVESGWFFAQSAEPERLAVPTLDTIRWAGDRAYVTGPTTVAK